MFGTPAPEQLEGRAATTSSDIYALGLVIYEMVTGARPFQGDTPISAAMKRLSEPPLPPRTFEPKLDPLWESTILRCLERDPTKRITNPEEVGRTLAIDHSVTASEVARKIRIWRAAAIVGGVLLLLIGVAGYSAWRESRQRHDTPSKSNARRSVAVLGFKNLSGKSESDWISTALVEELTSELAVGEKLRTIAGEDIARVKRDLPFEPQSVGAQTLLRIERMLDSDLVVTGSYLDFDQQLRIDVQVQDAKAGKTIAIVTDHANEAQIVDLVSRIGKALRENCGAGEITLEQAQSLKAALPGSTELARLYADGLNKLQVYDAVSARDLLEKATQSDPDYSAAHSALSLAWSQLGYEDRSQQEAKRAFELSTNLSRAPASGHTSNFRRNSCDARFHRAHNLPKLRGCSWQANDARQGVAGSLENISCNRSFRFLRNTSLVEWYSLCAHVAPRLLDAGSASGIRRKEHGFATFFAFARDA